MAVSSSIFYAALVLLALFLFAHFDASALTAALRVLPLASLALPAVAFYLRRRQPPATHATKLKTAEVADAASADPATADECEDNVRWSFMPSNGIFKTNMTEAVHSESEFTKFRFLVLHRPTHDKALDASGKWRYGWHFKRRKRIWEVRCQVQWKRVPRGQIYFGLEMAPGQEKSSGSTARIKDLILTAIRTAIGKEFYQTAGDPPSSTADELEPPTFVMPLWAVDQFEISDLGQEPDLTGDLNGVGMLRTNDFKAYQREMGRVVENIDTTKVYTFCFWGVSQFIDVNMWEFKGLLPGVRMDASKLSGPPPIFVTCYEMKESDDDELLADGRSRPRRHLISKKDYYFQVALWSELKSPEPEFLKKVLSLPDEAVETLGRRQQTDANANVTVLRRALDAMPECLPCGAGAPRLDHQEGGRASRRREEQNFLLKAGQKVLGGCMGQQ